MEKRIMENIFHDIESRSSEIIQSIAPESVYVYQYLSSQLNKTDVNTDYFYQFVYRSFFRLDNAGLTDEFKFKYFELLESYKKIKDFNYLEILCQLYEIPNKQKNNTFQFSFVTKMCNIIHNNKPIFDGNVIKVLNLKKTYKKGFNEKYSFYIEQYSELEILYEKIFYENLLQKSLLNFDKKFPKNKLSVNKKIDFILWSEGKN
jgi:hypothetical protein